MMCLLFSDPDVKPESGVGSGCDHVSQGASLLRHGPLSRANRHIIIPHCATAPDILCWGKGEKSIKSVFSFYALSPWITGDGVSELWVALGAAQT